MGFIYSSLNRGAGESVALFDNRIARMLPFVTGKAYFDLRNYDAQTGEFGVYIEWDGELEAVLGYSLPAGGYFVKATTPQAYRFHRLDSGLPVYMKLIAQNGRLYPYRTYVMMDGRPFSVEFGGGVLIPFEDRYEELGCEAAKQTVDTGSRKLLMGSQSGMTGSQRIKNMLMVLESDTQQPQDSMDSIRTSQELMAEFPQEWQLINRSRRPTSRIGGNAKFGYGLDLI